MKLPWQTLKNQISEINILKSFHILDIPKVLL